MPLLFLACYLPHIEYDSHNYNSALYDLLQIRRNAQYQQAVVNDAQYEYTADDTCNGADTAGMRIPRDRRGGDGIQFIAHAKGEAMPDAVEREVTITPATAAVNPDQV